MNGFQNSAIITDMNGNSANDGLFTPGTAQGRHYDAIIVGGGTAGLVAAARLSEDASKNILVIEAGADRRGDPKIDTPGAFMGLWGDKDYDWNFYSESQVCFHTIRWMLRCEC